MASRQTQQESPPWLTGLCLRIRAYLRVAPYTCLISIPTDTSSAIFWFLSRPFWLLPFSPDEPTIRLDVSPAISFARTQVLRFYHDRQQPAFFSSWPMNIKHAVGGLFFHCCHRHTAIEGGFCLGFLLIHQAAYGRCRPKWLTMSVRAVAIPRRSVLGRPALPTNLISSLKRAQKFGEVSAFAALLRTTSHCHSARGTLVPLDCPCLHPLRPSVL